MKVYNYHPEYKYLIGSEDAFESPLEPGVFLIPAHATDIEPPSCGKDEIQVFNETFWEIIKDKRGVYYSTENQELVENYNPLEFPLNATKEKPPEVPKDYKLEWNNKWILKENPKPPELTPLEKLNNSGLTIEELKTLLGLTT